MGFSKNIALLPLVCEIHFATVDQVIGHLAGTTPHTIMPVLKKGAWEQLYFTQDTLSFSGGMPSHTDHGSLYEYKVSLRYPGIDFKHVNPHAFAALDQYEWILALTYTDGTTRIIGSVEQGLTFTWMETLANKGFILNWEMLDTEPAANLDFIQKFFINDDQHLIQRYEDANTYDLTADKHLTGLGPTADDLEYDEGQLISNPG